MAAITKQPLTDIPLTPKEEVAKAMLLYHSKDPIESLNFASAVSAAVAEVFANDPDPSEDAIDAAALKAVQGLGYITDLDAIARLREHLDANHAGYWAGNYAVLDTSGQVHSLQVTSERIRLLLEGTDVVMDVPSEGGPFQARTLVHDNEHIAVKFALSTTLDGVDFTDESIDVAALGDRYQVLLHGTLEVKAAKDGPRAIVGKRGVSTAAGINHDRTEEPPWLWSGRYWLQRTDTERWEWLDERLEIECADGSRKITLRLGDQAATDVEYRNNAMFCVLTGGRGPKTRATVQLTTTSQGLRTLYVWLQTPGQIRTLNAYAERRPSPRALWQGVPGRMLATARARGDAHASAMLLGDGVVDLCRTVYDSIFSVKDTLLTTGGVALADLFKSDAIDEYVAPTPTNTSPSPIKRTGFRVDETDKDGNLTGRVALYSLSAAITDRFPDGTRLKGYQLLDDANLPQVGLRNNRVGILLDRDLELPGLVETDFYEVRFSLVDFWDAATAKGLSKDGLRIDLAIDDQRQPGLIKLAQPDKAACAIDDADTGNGPDKASMDRVVDFQKASVLVRGTTGETQVVGHKTYYFAVLKRQAVGAPVGFYTATRTIFAPAEANPKQFSQVQVDSVPVPLLVRVPIQMDSRDALEVTGTGWPNATRGKAYSPKIHAEKGQQPFAWRVLKNDLPSGLSWDTEMGIDSDKVTPGATQVGVNGTVAESVAAGSTFHPSVRIMNDKSVVMKPGIAAPSIYVQEPELHNKASWDIVGVIAGAIGGLTIGAIGVIVTVILNRKERKEAKKDAQVTGGKFTEAVDKFIDKIDTNAKELKERNEELLEKQETLEDVNLKLEKLKKQSNKAKQARDRLSESLKNAKTEIERLKFEKQLREEKERSEVFDKEESIELEKKDKREEKKKSKEKK